MEWLAATITGYVSIEVIRRAWAQDQYIWRWIFGGTFAISISISLVDAAARAGYYQAWGYQLVWCYVAILIATAIVVIRGDGT